MRYKQSLCHFKGVFLHCENKVVRAAKQYQQQQQKLWISLEIIVFSSFHLFLAIYFSRVALNSHICLLLSCICARLASTIFAILLCIWYCMKLTVPSRARAALQFNKCKWILLHVLNAASTNNNNKSPFFRSFVHSFVYSLLALCYIVILIISNESFVFRFYFYFYFALFHIFCLFGLLCFFFVRLFFACYSYLVLLCFFFVLFSFARSVRFTNQRCKNIHSARCVVLFWMFALLWKLTRAHAIHYIHK